MANRRFKISLGIDSNDNKSDVLVLLKTSIYQMQFAAAVQKLSFNNCCQLRFLDSGKMSNYAAISIASFSQDISSEDQIILNSIIYSPQYGHYINTFDDANLEDYFVGSAKNQSNEFKVKVCNYVSC